MSEIKVVVPEKMLDAVNGASVVAQNLHDESLFEMLEAALRWLSENPIVPTVEQSSDMMEKFPVNTTRNVCVEWQRRMFLKPDDLIQIPVGLMGRTFTRVEADAIIKVVNSSVAPDFLRSPLKCTSCGQFFNGVICPNTKCPSLVY